MGGASKAKNGKKGNMYSFPECCSVGIFFPLSPSFSSFSLPPSLPPSPFLSPDDNLQSHGTRGLSSPMLTGESSTLTRGRPLSHSMRKAKRLNTISVTNRRLPRDGSRVCFTLLPHTSVLNVLCFNSLNP